MSLPVSVQVCTLNEESNIAACLDAVLANEPAEILVIDGGSTDRTVELAQARGARVLTPGRLGLGPSRQVGYRATEQPYCAFVDADDRLPPGWLSTMLTEVQAGGYAALQSGLRAVPDGSWWSRGWNQYFIESVRPAADTVMVGRPALFTTSALRAVDGDLVSLDEDTHLSRRFELLGLRQGIGTAVVERHVEATWAENARKWRSYGRGYRAFSQDHPDRRAALIRHLLWTIPVRRSWRPLLRGHVDQPAFNLLMTWCATKGWLDRESSLQTPRMR